MVKKCIKCGKDIRFYDPKMKYCYDCYIKKERVIEQKREKASLTSIKERIKLNWPKGIGY